MFVIKHKLQSNTILHIFCRQIQKLIYSVCVYGVCVCLCLEIHVFVSLVNDIYNNDKTKCDDS